VTICSNVFRNITAGPIVVGASRRVRAFDNQGAAPFQTEDIAAQGAGTK
jgi:hypothetical protein